MEHKTLLSKDGYLINKNKFDKKSLNDIRKDLTVEPFQFGTPYGIKEKDNIFKVFRETDNFLCLPKFYGLEKIGIPEKNNEHCGEKVKINFKGELRDNQIDIINHVVPQIQDKDGGLICLSCGGGKCLGINTKIIMYDGSIKLVQNINVGDIIMGDDSKPRNILSVTTGYETMYKVIYDTSYIVNESHILSLKYNNKKIDISVKDYLLLDNKQDYCGYRVPLLFPEKNVTNPYLFGYKIKKYIPIEYKCNSKQNQLLLLAGIIDKYGIKFNNYYKIVCKNFRLLNDIIFLSRSLGFFVKNNNIYSSYTNLYEIPSKYKKFNYKTCKHELKYKIKLEKLENNKYYGFEIDGNRRFVLGDFTVTHNTVLALKIASIFNVKTLIIVHKSFLLNQWKERIQQFTDSSIGIIQQNKIDIDGKPIVIGMLQSIAKEKYDLNIFADFGLVIFDEAHHAPSKYFSKALPLISCKKTLALSATPKRSDRLEKILHWYFGPIIYKTNVHENKSVHVKMYNYHIVHDKFFEKKLRFTGKVNRPGTVTNLITIGRRNKFIIDILQEILFEDGRKILILSERIEHLELLKKRLDERNITLSGFYIGGMKQNKLDITATYPVIFGTFQMASEALDIKGLNTLIMATPRREIEQTIGRVTRDPNIIIKPLVIDIIDNLESFVKQSYHRKGFYNKNNFQITHFNVDNNIIINEEDVTNSKTNIISNDDVEFID
jgi:superfamily II DNA or RNA helicase